MIANFALSIIALADLFRSCSRKIGLIFRLSLKARLFECFAGGKARSSTGPQEEAYSKEVEPGQRTEEEPGFAVQRTGENASSAPLWFLFLILSWLFSLLSPLTRTVEAENHDVRYSGSEL